MGIEDISNLEHLFDRLWKLPRSLTGSGVRESLAILQEQAPYIIHEVASGKKVFDWAVPLEWNVRDAWLETPSGRKIARFTDNNLHLMGYSEPMDLTMAWSELKPHLHIDEKIPNAIPYRTSYYKRNWGFCITKNEYDRIPCEGDYRVFIDSSLEDGSLTYGDIVLDGRLDKEVFFSSYICHPSLANNELSGPLLQTLIYKYVSGLQNRRYTYRFLLAPETIGSIVYLDTYGEHFKANMLAGFILTCSGLDTHFTYKRSRKRNSYTDRLVERVLSRNQCAQKVGFEIRDFYPYGSDERQYCSPGFDLPVGSIMRGVPGEYPEYHTSADNKALLSFPALLDAFELYKEIIDEIESDRFYRSNNPCCEPRLGKHGLYPNTGGEGHDHDIHALNWVLNLSDGQHSIRDIIDISNLPTVTIEKSISKLVDAELIYLNGT